MRSHKTAAHSPKSSGFSLVELMIAMGLSLILLAGTLSVFASSRRTYESNERLGRIQENGRFALDQIVRDIRSSGYLGCSHLAPFNTTLNSSTGLLWNFALPIEGFESTGAGTWTPALDTTLLPSPANSSDAIAIRGANRDVNPQRLTVDLAAPTDSLQVTVAVPAVFQAGDVAMVSDCNGSSAFQIRSYAGGLLGHTATGANPGNADQDLGFAYQQGAEVYPVRTVVYYVRASATAGNGTSLWRRVGSGAPVELVEGIDTLQFQYGLDADGDRIVESYVAADAVTNWDEVISVSVGLLAHSITEYGPETDAQTYTVLNDVSGPFNDRRQRLVFSTTITVRNRAL